MPRTCLDQPNLTKLERQALKALAAGEAGPGDQGLALQVIMKKFSQPSELMYIPESPYDTAFMNGRGYVATLIRGVLSQNVESGDA